MLGIVLDREKKLDEADAVLDPSLFQAPVIPYVTADNYAQLNDLNNANYENQRPATERYNRLMCFDPNATNPISNQVAPLRGQTVKGAFQYASGNNWYAWPADNTNFAPRLGIAYRITDKLVARAGAGIFYLPASAMISFDNPGEFYGYASQATMIATQTGGFYPANLVSNPFPGGVNQPTRSSLGPLTLLGDGLGQIWIKASSFAAPPSEFALGNDAQRYSQLRERAERNVDLPLAKTFASTKRFRAQFRGEAFNVFNYAQYNFSAFHNFPLCVTCGHFGRPEFTGKSSKSPPVQPQATFLMSS